MAEPARSSSPPPTIETPRRSNVNYAFLIHSQKTLTENLPPRVDNKPLARQKRRRTSPEDHAILEAAYRKNPKPDKATRADIVRRVSLGNKEVQIWFQNRRQNERRKFKLVQVDGPVAPDLSTDSSLESNSDVSVSMRPEVSAVEQLASQDSDASSPEVVEPRPEDVAARSCRNSVTHQEVKQEKEHVPDNLKASRDMANQELTEDGNDTELDTESIKAQDGRDILKTQPVSAKRKRVIPTAGIFTMDSQHSLNGAARQFESPPSLRLSLSFDGEARVRKEGDLTPSPPKSRNALRISMSSDGEAVIRAGNEPSPAKNRISIFPDSKPRTAGLRRSNSVVVFGTPRGDKTFGRSREARNWECVFDTDARSALSTPTSYQSTPTERTYTSLTRSFSAKQASQPLSSAVGNSSGLRPSGGKRRKLSRTVSSLGRLESGENLTSNKTVEVVGPELEDQLPYKKKLRETDECYGDSDKENWIPGTHISRTRRRTTSHPTRRPALHEANGVGRKSGKNVDGKRGLSLQENHVNQPVQLSFEMSAFMAAARKGNSQDEDLDCIQGLLSLSQGAWR